MATNLSGNALTLGGTSLNEETLKAIKTHYYVPDNCQVGDTVILDGIECLCVATGITIQGTNLTRIAVDKKYNLGYYQKYSGISYGSNTVNRIDFFKWGGYGTLVGDTSTETGYGYQNTINCLSKKVVFTAGSYNYSPTATNFFPYLWSGVNDFRSAHSDKWFVPSIAELRNYVYPRKSSLTISPNISLLSSSEYSANECWLSYFYDGRDLYGDKYAATNIRLCRVF